MEESNWTENECKAVENRVSIIESLEFEDAIQELDDQLRRLEMALSIKPIAE